MWQLRSSSLYIIVLSIVVEQSCTIITLLQLENFCLLCKIRLTGLSTEYKSFQQEIEFLARLKRNTGTYLPKNYNYHIYYYYIYIVTLQLCRYRHKHIVQKLGVCVERDQLAFVLENMELGSLFHHLHEVNETLH